MSNADFKPRKVAVFKGGPSAEREVSLASGAAVGRGLREAGYEVEEVDLKEPSLPSLPGVDAVFIALHGAFGEDGQVQQLLADRGIPFTGSDAASSRISFDKRLTKAALVDHDIPTPTYELISRGEASTLPLPLIVKPPCQGSTIGIHRIFSDEDWAPALKDAFSYEDELLVEAFIDGRELTVGIVNDLVLPIVEIRAPGGYYDYSAKYTKGQSKYLVPAPLPDQDRDLCQELALQTFKALGCRGLGRVDIRLTMDGEPFVLELNSIPGFTETSLLPMAAAKEGISFSALCDRIIRSAEV